jgi:pyridoxamine 5'-phosphate oxidase
MPLNLDLAGIRKSYSLRELTEESVANNPFTQFSTWLEEAIQAGVPEPTAMILSTADAAGVPSARVVLLKGLEEDVFRFYTNYRSHKGRDLAENPAVALTFFWPELERQVRVEGQVEKSSGPQSDAYYQSRPLGSQIGAWASEQSQPVADRQELEKTQATYEQRFAGQTQIPRPDHWGGYQVTPKLIEFWQGRPNRLHDRIVYTRRPEQADWQIGRLAP